MSKMQRIKLLLGMALLAAAMVCVVAFCSPYDPVIGPVMDIEEIWAIEDARRESDVPLVTALECNGVPMAYWAQENTYYCTLGLEQGEEWPQMHLCAKGEPGVSVCFVDDYAYDWCCEAIREGYAYQAMAYTDEAYMYFNVVFTGLPIVSIQAQTDIPAHEDVPAELTLSWDDHTVFSSHIRTHERGDSSLRLSEKHGLKVEFTRNADGTKKISQEMPGLGLTKEFILIAFAFEPQLVRDRLSWEIWNGITQESEPFGVRRTQYAEVFVNGDYKGVYLMMEPYDYVEELGKCSAAAVETDSVYRLVGGHVYEFDRALTQDSRNIFYEAHYVPEGEAAFSALEPYLALMAEEDDEAFCEQAQALLNMDSVIRYCLFVEAGTMMDSERNNLYIWAHRENGRLTYSFGAWDLDNAWGKQGGIENTNSWIPFPLFDRLLRLDCGGFFCSRTYEIWRQMRETVYNEAFVGGVLEEYEHLLGDSGAYRRDAQRWNRQQTEPNATNILTFATEHFLTMDTMLEEMTDPRTRVRYFGGE